MDAEYLKATVGAVLTAGLTEMVLKRPEDPVDYLASFLRNAVEDKVARIERNPVTQSHTHYTASNCRRAHGEASPQGREGRDDLSWR